MPTTLSRKLSYTIEGDYKYTTLAFPEVVAFRGDYAKGEADIFAQAALWLSENPGYTIISTAFTYIFENEELQLLLTVE